MMRTVAAALACVLAAAQDGKVQLRYKFEKGQKLRLEIKQSTNVKVEEIPEAFKGLMGETPVDIKFEGLLEAEVKEVAEDGKASIEGKWRTLKAKGNMMLNEVDFAYDAEKPDAAQPRKKEGPDADLPAFGNLEDGLRAMAREPVSLSVEPSGRMRLRGGGGAAGVGDMAEQLLSFNGLMGPFPKDAVGKGDAWKADEKIQMPGVGGTMAIAIKSENRYEADETVDGRACAVLQSKLTVGGEGDRKEDADNPLPVRFKTSGGGEGKCWFSTGEGMMARAKNSLQVKIVVGFPDPGGGGDIEIRAVLKIDQGHELKR